MSTPNIDDVAQTLAEYEALAISTGATVQIDPPEFSSDGTTWAPIWLASEPPVAGRATVHRGGVPTQVYATWTESLPLESSLTADGRRWCDIWVAKPMQRFGSYLVRSALRRAYRDAIGDRIEPDEDAPRVADEPAGERDWDAEILACSHESDVTELHKQMKAARAVTVARERALREQLLQVTRTVPADAWALPPIAASVEVPEVAATVPNEQIVSVADAVEQARRAPQDHLPPANRAARRKAARKKGGKR